MFANNHQRPFHRSQKVLLSVFQTIRDYIMNSTNMIKTKTRAKYLAPMFCRPHDVFAF